MFVLFVGRRRSRVAAGGEHGEDPPFAGRAALRWRCLVGSLSGVPGFIRSLAIPPFEKAFLRVAVEKSHVGKKGRLHSQEPARGLSGARLSWRLPMTVALNPMQGREIPGPLPCPGRFDPHDAWRGLPRASQGDLGAWPLVPRAGYAGTEREAKPAQTYETAVGEAIARLKHTAPVALAALFCDGLPPPQDLGALGGRNCHRGRCTDFIGCPDSCWWVRTDLCSGCGDAGKPEGSRA